MVDERPTPEDELEDDPPDTPPDEGEPAEAVEPEERPDQPAPGVIAQAEYTRATQLNAAVRKELGLPKGATLAEVMDALRARAVADDGDDEGEEVEPDPRVVAAERRAYEAELRVQQAVYGEETTAAMLELANTIREADSVEDVFQAIAAFQLEHPATTTPPPAAAAPATSASDEGPAGDIGMSEGDRATPPATSAPSGRRETGVVSAIRDLLAGATGAGRPS